MADSTTSSLNLSTESYQVGPEDAMEIQITNQPAADDGNLGKLTQIIFMDPKLYNAAADGDRDFFEKEGPKYDIHVQLTPQKNTILHVAAQFGQADCVDKILQLTSASSLLQQPNEKGDTPLHLAAREGHLTVVKKLIGAAKKPKRDAEGGAATDYKEMLQMTNTLKDAALHEAVRNHHPEVVKLLIQEDPEFNYGANAEGNTPLYIAAEWGFGDLVEMILGLCPSPAYGGIKGRTALHAAVILNSQAMTKKILEKKPALTNELDDNGWSPLHFAAYVGCDPTIVRQLLFLKESDSSVVYLGIKDYGNRTALHIAARRGHVDIVKLLVSHFPDCCEKVDDDGNNVLHLIMPKKIFVTSGLSNNLRLRVRGLMNEKNAEGKTPLHLWHTSPFSEGVNYYTPPERRFTRVLDTFVRLRRRSPSFRASIRPLGSLEVKEDIDRSKSEGSEEITGNKGSEETSEIKKTMKSHMIVAALIATVAFAAVFTPPGGYIQDEGKHQGMAVLSFPPNGTEGKDLDTAIAMKKDFTLFVCADYTAMSFSLCAILFYFLAAHPFNKKNILRLFLVYGYTYTIIAMAAMGLAFLAGLQITLHHSSVLGNATRFMSVLLFLVCIFSPGFLFVAMKLGFVKRMSRYV